MKDADENVHIRISDLTMAYGSLVIQRELGLTAVLVTHDWADARTLSDTVVVLNQGRIEQSGTVADLIERPASAFVRSMAWKSSMTSRTGYSGTLT